LILSSVSKQRQARGKNEGKSKKRKGKSKLAATIGFAFLLLPYCLGIVILWEAL
jgi:hypothetical protein